VSAAAAVTVTIEACRHFSVINIVADPARMTFPPIHRFILDHLGGRLPAAQMMQILAV
jgi:hypothetical protein